MKYNFEKYQLLVFDDFLAYIEEVSNGKVTYVFTDNGKLDNAEFYDYDFDNYFATPPTLHTLKIGDFFYNKDFEITINYVDEGTFNGVDTKNIYYILYDKVKNLNSSHEKIAKNFLDFLIMNDFVLGTNKIATTSNSATTHNFEMYDLLLFDDKIYYLGGTDYEGTKNEKIDYFFKDNNGKLEVSSFKIKEFDKFWVKKPIHHKLQVGDVFLSKDKTIVTIIDIDKSAYGTQTIILFSQEDGSSNIRHQLYMESFVKELLKQDFVYQGNNITQPTSLVTTSTIVDDVDEIDDNLKMYDIISLKDEMFYVSKTEKRGSTDNYKVFYKYLTSDNKTIGELDFFIDDMDKIFDEVPNLYRLSSGDVFVNEFGGKVVVDEVNVKITKTTKPKMFSRLVKFTVITNVESNQFEKKIGEFLDSLLLGKYNIEVQRKVVQTTTSIEPLDLKGDFISQFVNNNATNLLELEKNNRPLFDVVEMTLNLLSKKFGKGESVGEKVDVVIDNAEEIITSVKGQDPNLIGLKEIEIRSNEGAIDLVGRVFTTWTDFTNALKPLYDDTIGGYNKVKFVAKFDDGRYIIDRIDVGQKDFNPMTMKVGEYVDRPFAYFDNLDDDLDKYQWDEVVVVTEGGEDAVSREDIENEINALNISLMFEEDQQKIDEINEKINALNITLTLI